MPKRFFCGGTRCVTDILPGIHAHLMIDRDGNVQWNGTPVSRKEFESYLDMAAKDREDTIFWIKADAGTPYAKLFPLVLTLQQHKIAHTAFTDK